MIANLVQIYPLPKDWIRHRLDVKNYFNWTVKRSECHMQHKEFININIQYNISLKNPYI